jgi:hypothetical protein
VRRIRLAALPLDSGSYWEVLSQRLGYGPTIPVFVVMIGIWVPADNYNNFNSQL